MIKKIIAINLFGFASFCMLGAAPAQDRKSLHCPDEQFVCGSGDYTMCCKVGTWCCQYRNSPQYYCSATKKCEYGSEY